MPADDTAELRADIQTMRAEMGLEVSRLTAEVRELCLLLSPFIAIRRQGKRP